MVVLKVFDFNSPDIAHPLCLEDDKAFRVHKFNGDDTLQFEIQRNNDLYSKIKEEVKVEAFNNRFVIKQIDEHSDFVVVNCDLDFSDFKKRIYKNFRRVNDLIGNILVYARPVDWTVTYYGVDQTKRGTIEESEGEPFIAATQLEILDKASSVFGVVFNFEMLSKRLIVINPEAYTPSGEFIMENLNLSEIGFNGDSSGLITRLYVYGKKDETTGQYLNIKSVNDNLEYVDNFQYTDEILCGTWVDERYTIAQNLHDAAVRKLAELSKPQRSYTCDIINLNKDIWLYKIITLIDSRRNQRVNHQVIEFVEYNDHSLDKCTLSTKPPSIGSIVKSLSFTLEDDMISGIQEVVDKKTQQLSDMITGSKGGYFKWIYDANNNPIELVNLYGSEDITRAQKVWRWNSGGLGHSNNGYSGTYTLALTENGEINASMITTGVLNAGVIKAGTIQDVSGNNSWNLETGSFTMASGSISLGNNFSVNSNGEAQMTNATITGGTVTTTAVGYIGSGRHEKKMVVGSGIMTGYDNDIVTGLLDLAATYADGGRHVALKSYDVLHLQSGDPSDGGREITIDEDGAHGVFNGTFNGTFNIDGLTGRYTFSSRTLVLENGIVKQIL